MIPVSDRLAQPVELDLSDHPRCALTSAVSLIAGKPASVSRRAYPFGSPSRIARLLQVGNGVLGALQSIGRQRTLISGEKLAYREGEVKYSTDHLLRRWRGFQSLTRPFFVVANGDPAGSIAAITGCDPEPAPRLHISRFQCTVVIMANWGGAPAVLHYAGCSDSIAELLRTASGLEIAGSDRQIHHLLAHLLAHRILSNGAAVLVQSRIPADPYQFSWRRIDAATDLWLSRKPIDNGGAIFQVDPRLTMVCEFFPRFRELLLPAAEALREWNDSARIPGDLAHGDFWLGNVLFKGDAVAGVIDWEWARKDGIPIADLLHMLLRSPAMEQDASFAQCFRELWADEITDAEQTERIARLRAQSGMGQDDLKFIGLMLWFDLLWQRAVRGVVESAPWLDDMIPQTVPAIMKWLNRR